MSRNRYLWDFVKILATIGTLGTLLFNIWTTEKFTEAQRYFSTTLLIIIGLIAYIETFFQKKRRLSI